MTWTTRPRFEGPGGLAYWREGAGPALVLIHGVGLRAEAWGAMMPLLATEYAVYALDMPGHGDSHLSNVSSLADYATRIANFVETLEGPVAVAGHSMGAILSLHVARALPKKVNAVAAINAIYRRTPEAAQAVRDRAASLATGKADPAPTLARWFGDAPVGDKKACADACRDWLTNVDYAAYAAAYHHFAHQEGPSEDQLKALDIPALFLTADGDPNSTPAMSQAMAALAPKGRAHVVKNAAHMMPMTHPQDAARELLATLKDAS